MNPVKTALLFSSLGGGSGWLGESKRQGRVDDMHTQRFYCCVAALSMYSSICSFILFSLPACTCSRRQCQYILIRLQFSALLFAFRATTSYTDSIILLSLYALHSPEMRRVLHETGSFSPCGLGFLSFRL
jgi:hypothetical protein